MADRVGIFHAIDRDDSGELDQREFITGLNRLGLGLTGVQFTLLVRRWWTRSSFVVRGLLVLVFIFFCCCCFFFFIVVVVVVVVVVFSCSHPHVTGSFVKSYLF